MKNPMIKIKRTQSMDPLRIGLRREQTWSKDSPVCSRILATLGYLFVDLLYLCSGDWFRE